MLTMFQAVFLGIIQGITEFLPVSSSGHLVVVQQLFGWQAEGNVILAFDVALHIGTLFAVLLAFRKDIADMLTGKAWRMFYLLILATIPAVVFGFTMKDAIEAMFSSGSTVGIEFLITGAMLLGTRFVKDNVIASPPKAGEASPCAQVQTGDCSSDEGLSWWKSLLIGCAQAVAILPAISRSGATICAGLFLKLDKQLAARFAFLMSIPAIAGGALMDAKELVNFPKEALPQLLIGTLVSFVVGYFSIAWLLSIIQKGKFWWFGVYCVVIGILTSVWIAVR